MNLDQIKNQLAKEINWPASEIIVTRLGKKMVSFSHGKTDFAAWLTETGKVKKHSYFVIVE